MVDFPKGNAEEPNATKSDFKLLLGLLIGALVVLGLGFVTLLLQYFTATQVSYEDLKNQVTAQNQIMGQLVQKFENCNAKKSSGC